MGRVRVFGCLDRYSGGKDRFGLMYVRSCLVASGVYTAKHFRKDIHKEMFGS